MADPVDAPFPGEEYRARLAAVRSGMAVAGLDLLVITSPENLYYLSGYGSAGYFAVQALLVGLAAEPVLITRALETPNAAATLIYDRHVPYRDHEEPMAVVAREIEALGAATRRIGVERSYRYLTIANLDRLAARLPRARFGDSSRLVEAVRLRKSPRELELIRRAARILDGSMAACFEAIRPGRREREVAADVYHANVLGGSEWSGTPPFIVSGPRSARPHTTWGERALQGGDPVFVEIGACVRRYHAVMMRSVVLAPVSERLRSMHAASRDGLEAAFGAIRPGVTAAEVDRACRQAIGRAGWGEAFRLRSGYSMGLGFEGFAEGHILSLHEGERTPIETGMGLLLVPFLLAEGEAGLAVSETVIVTETGAEVAGTVPRDLVVR